MMLTDGSPAYSCGLNVECDLRGLTLSPNDWRDLMQTITRGRARLTADELDMTRQRDQARSAAVAMYRRHVLGEPSPEFLDTLHIHLIRRWLQDQKDQARIDLWIACQQCGEIRSTLAYTLSSPHSGCRVCDECKESNP